MDERLTLESAAIAPPRDAPAPPAPPGLDAPADPSWSAGARGQGLREARPHPATLAEMRRLRAIIDASEDGIFSTDARGVIVGWNRSATRILGYTPDDALGMPASDLFVAPGELLAHLERARHGGAPHVGDSVWIHRTAGRLRVALTLSGLHGEDGEFAGAVLSFRDDTERRRSQERLRLMESVVINTNDAVVITDPNVGTALGPTILFVNDAFCQITGYTEEEVLGKSPRILYGPDTDPATLERLRYHLGRQEPVRVEIVEYAKNGRPYWVDLSMVPAFDAGGRLTHLIAVEREITERKLAERLEHDQRKVLEMIARGADLGEVVKQILHMVERQRAGVRAALLLDVHGRFRHLMSGSVAADLITSLDSPEEKPWSRWLQDSAGRLRPSFVNSVAHHPQWQDLARHHGGRVPGAVWAVPVRSGSDQIQGLLVVYSDEEGEPSHAEVDLLEMSARLVSIGVEQRQLSEQLVHQAQHDALTKLPNRYLFEVRLQEALRHCDPRVGGVGLLCIDLDRFKQINDTLGHSVGDELLVQVARRLGTCTRATDTLARMGGDEFVLILNHLRDSQTAIHVAERLIAVLKEPFIIGGYELVLTTSIGIGIYPQDGEDATTLFKNTDSALYHAKASGRNTFKCFRPRMNAMTFERLELENELRRALDRHELLLYYQPQVDLRTLEVVGFEALVRWRHHKLGMVSPGEFIPLAEEVGMIIPIGEWVLREACRQKVEWEVGGLPGVKISVNVSALQFGHDGFVETVSSALASTGLRDNSWLDLEVTEALLAKDIGVIAARLERMRALGVSVSIDDFGTGYSSLAYLQRLPIDTVKIDGSFVRGIGAADTGRGDPGALVRAVVTLGHNLGLSVVAEGVETGEQLAFLQGLGCDRAQGFLFSRPVPAEEAFERYGARIPLARAG